MTEPMLFLLIAAMVLLSVALGKLLTDLRAKRQRRAYITAVLDRCVDRRNEWGRL
jgi:hypothetical protein